MLPTYFNDFLVPRNLMFESTAREAATLTMPEGASTENLLNEQVVRNCIAKNARAWYEYARGPRGRIVQNGDIRVVVGWDKVCSWGIATSTCASGQSVSLVFKIDDDSEAGTSRAYRWDCIGSASVRVGPLYDEISDLMQENNPAPQNQSVFVRTMNFTLAGAIWDDYSPTAVQRVLASGRGNPRGSATTHRRTRGRGQYTSGSGVSLYSQSSSVQGSLHTPQSVIFDMTEHGVRYTMLAFWLTICLHIF